MEFIFILGFVAIGLAVINSILLLVKLFIGSVKLHIGLLIVVGSAVLPYGLALFAAGFGKNGWDGMDRALNTWIISGFLMMIVVLIYLATIKKGTKEEA